MDDDFREDPTHRYLVRNLMLGLNGDENGGAISFRFKTGDIEPEFVMPIPARTVEEFEAIQAVLERLLILMGKDVPTN